MRHLLILLMALPLVAAAADPFEIKDGERIAYVGNTFVERDQTYGYFETLLTSRFHDKKFIWRNLGWSGDTVWGEARAGFGDRNHGYAQLIKQVTEVKPTLIFLCYGMNESFEGEKGLSAFTQQFEKLLTDLEAICPRVVVLAPNEHVNLGPPFPDPADHNDQLLSYTRAIFEICKKRKHTYVDPPMFAPGSNDMTEITDNGIHLSSLGYWIAAGSFLSGLELATFHWKFEANAKKPDIAPKIEGAGRITSTSIDRERISFTIAQSSLPLPPRPVAVKPPRTWGGRQLRIDGLASGTYLLKIDGIVAGRYRDSELKKGISVNTGPDYDQAESLRKLINKKNELFFHRWRPQNETYIFGFRKSEQGRNAVEIPQFDPLIEELEKEIWKLATPIARTYTLEKDEKKKEKE